MNYLQDYKRKRPKKKKHTIYILSFISNNNKLNGSKPFYIEFVNIETIDERFHRHIS